VFSRRRHPKGVRGLAGQHRPCQRRSWRNHWPAYQRRLWCVRGPIRQIHPGAVNGSAPTDDLATCSSRLLGRKTSSTAATPSVSSVPCLPARLRLHSHVRQQRHPRCPGRHPQRGHTRSPRQYLRAHHLGLPAASWVCSSFSSQMIRCPLRHPHQLEFQDFSIGGLPARGRAVFEEW